MVGAAAAADGYHRRVVVVAVVVAVYSFSAFVAGQTRRQLRDGEPGAPVGKLRTGVSCSCNQFHNVKVKDVTH